MDLTLAKKFIITCLVCEIIVLATGVPLKDIHNGSPSIKTKRSPENYSFFGLGIKPTFTVPNPFLSIKQTWNGFGNLFTPAVASRNVNNENLHRPAGFQNTFRNVQPRTEIPVNVLPTRSNVNKVTATLPSGVSVKPNTEPQNIEFDKYAKNIENRSAENDVKFQQIDEDNKRKPVTSSSKDSTSKNDEQIIEIDKDILDSIFKDVNKNGIDSITTTEDSVMDYTTGTGDYDSTTIDELLRIPAPVVATLLG